MSITNKNTENPEEEKIFINLRAQNWQEYYGQKTVKKSLAIAIKAAQKREEPLEHILLYGPPGLGKTTLSHIIAREMNVNIRITSGPAIDRAGDLASILTNLEEGDILFIDEIHRLNKVVEEVMYPAMEDYAIDIILGKGPSARTVRLDLPRFTIVGATTRIGLLSAPLRDRFGVIHRLNFYDAPELHEILANAASRLNTKIDPEGIDEIARRARGTPRIALRLLKRVRDYAQVHDSGVINKKTVDEALKMLEIDTMGLDTADKRYLMCVIEKYDGGPVGIETIAASISEDLGTVEDVIEPYLMQIGYLKRTPRGRVVTPQAYKHLAITPKVES